MSAIDLFRQYSILQFSALNCSNCSLVISKLVFLISNFERLRVIHSASKLILVVYSFNERYFMMYIYLSNFQYTSKLLLILFVKILKIFYCLVFLSNSRNILKKLSIGKYKCHFLLKNNLFWVWHSVHFEHHQMTRFLFPCFSITIFHIEISVPIIML